MPKTRSLLALALFLATVGGAQEIDEPVASARLEGGSWRNGAFTAWASGAVDGTHYYLLSTNVYFGALPQPAGECRYFDPIKGEEWRIGEKVVGYEGDNSFSFLQGSDPGFDRLRVVSPCFDGRYGEPTEQDHRTYAYGGGSLVYSPAKGKHYLTVNRTRLQSTPNSIDPAEQASNGSLWQAGDFDQIFIGAYGSIGEALHRPTSPSGFCRGESQPPASESCTPSVAWNWAPMVQITEDLVDPVDGEEKTFSALPPLLAAYDLSVENLPLFAGIGARGAVLFGFMEFGHICREWEIHPPPDPPTCRQGMGGQPNRLAAVYLSDGGGIRPTKARLHFKMGSNWIAMNKNGTFPMVPDNFRSLFPMADYSDVKYSPVTSSWKVWGSKTVTPNPVTGCDETHAQATGGSLAFANIAGGPVVEFWPSRNSFGRVSPHAHYVYAPACDCTREFIFYSGTDWACYNEQPGYNNAFGPFLGFEVTVRRWLDGPPNQ